MIPLHDDNPTQRTPIVTMIFIGICVAVFLYQVNLPQEAANLFAFQYGAIPAIVFGQASLPEEAVAFPASLSLVTSMFLHGGWMHLLGNMLYLWIFGNNIEDV
ncbi:MAG: rhomboid family intramembrane serine protease, partial [Nitrospirota bacterium]